MVTLKAAMTLDGKIAPSPLPGLKREIGIPAGGWITGEAARANVQLQRHQRDAILVGVGTILADDPLLTDRSGCERRRRLLRVVLDSHLRIPLESRIVQSASENDVLIFCSSADNSKKHELEVRGVEVEEVESDRNGRPDIYAILRHLGKREITSVMIEGGSTVNGMALAAGVVDKVFLYYAPKIIAGATAVPFAQGASSFGVAEIPQIKRLQVHRFGDDFAVEGYLRDPYEA
jgi:diaminohydroxyphosphoribosylaminopyrimidine deaminase/5-amino-6-(5-phosphoribosylamino)uracil reductase